MTLAHVLGQEVRCSGSARAGIFFKYMRQRFALGQLGQVGILLPNQMQALVAALAPAEQVANAAQA